MASDLQDLAETLLAINRQIVGVAGALGDRAGRLRLDADRARWVVVASGRFDGGELAATFAEAARSCDAAAALLQRAARDGAAYAASIVSGGGGGGGDQVGGSGLLTATDRMALAEYTGTAYTAINRALRGEIPLDADLRGRIVRLSTALRKLPVHTGTVVRGEWRSSPEAMADLRRYRRGAVVELPAFISSDTVKPFAGNVQYEIRSSTGRDIGAWSTYAGSEHEVLFDRSTRFVVEAVTPLRNAAGDTVWYIVMREQA